MSTEPLEVPFNRYRNNAKVIELGAHVFAKGETAGVMQQIVRPADNDRLVTTEGHYFVNFSSCDYLGLHRHKKVLQGAADTVLEQGFFALSLSPVRLNYSIRYELEEKLGQLFRCDLLLGPSCSSLSEGILPILASGGLTNGQRPFMIFDKHCHFSMSITTPMCGDETHVTMCNHNDIAFIEEMCKKHPFVMYVGDGTYSMGGQTLMQELIRLQEQYGLFIYLDDSHSLSLHGPNGCGFVRSLLGDRLNDRTIIVASLAKAFGAAGGVLMHGFEQERALLMRRFGGPIGWSQSLPTPCVGACLASAEIHASDELGQLQQTLRDRLAQFDSLLPTSQAGGYAPIRLVEVGEEDKAVELSSRLFQSGFYSSAVFFPIVARGKAGIRVMLRANNRPEDVERLAHTIIDLRQQLGVGK